MRILNWKDPQVNQILLPYFMGAKKRVKHYGKNLIGRGQKLIWMINFCQEIFWSRIEILLKSYRNLIGILYEEILRISYGTNLVGVLPRWRESVKTTILSLGKNLFGKFVKTLNVSQKQREAIVHTRYIFAATNQTYVGLEEFLDHFLIFWLTDFSFFSDCLAFIVC